MRRLIFYLLLGLGLFYLQNLLIPPNQTRLDLLSLLIFYEGSRPFLLSPVLLAIFLGIIVSSYSCGPLGLQAGLYLLIVIMAQFFRRHLNLQHAVPQILAAGIALGCQGLLQLMILHILEPSGIFHFEAVRFNLERAGITALLAPPAFALCGWLDKSASGYFYQSWSVTGGRNRSD